ncbi:hypothetical protein ACFO9Q_08430 [Paenibacillus sp. GCM10023252]|uniref:hypothetical protein n=1 Tax=Paenibacillus sp. GCM10023252 TaxID=3252649 RepID=UPI00361DAD64
MPKPLVFPELVTASITRCKHEGEVLSVRHSTHIQLGDSSSDELLGIVVMTNPGSYTFKDNSEWDKSASQPDGKKAEDYHKKVEHFISSTKEINRSLLEDPVTHERDRFLEECSSSKFVIMGFVKKVFMERMREVQEWSKESDKIVCAIDSKGHQSHPFSWGLNPELKNKAIESLVNVLRR